MSLGGRRSRAAARVALLGAAASLAAAGSVPAELSSPASQEGADRAWEEVIIRLPTPAPAPYQDKAVSFEAGVARAFRHLRSASATSQADLRAFLDRRGIEYRAFWIANALWARLDADTLAQVAARTDVVAIEPQRTVSHRLPHPTPAAERSTRAVEWGVNRVNAPALWARGFLGQGVVIGGQDTGYQWDHPALRASYRGWNGVSADHDHHWHDAVHALIGGGSNPCGVDAQAPCDDHNHGTHTMGTMVGDDGAGNQIGVAPQARWIGCRNMERGNGTPATYLECFQWFMAPTDVAGNNPRPSLAPHIINNSWGCPSSEGCSSVGVLEEAVDNLRAAGILVVVSAGNSGSSCGSIDTAPAPYPSSFTVGSFSSSNAIASSSSRGPVTVDGSLRLKPDIAAPGVAIRSSIRGGGYGNSSGTSMAGPHVAGVAALLMSADPGLRGHPARVEDLLRGSAIASTSTQNCAPYPGDGVPNAVFGYGRVDAEAAWLALGQVFRDGFE